MPRGSEEWHYVVEQGQGELSAHQVCPVWDLLLRVSDHIPSLQKGVPCVPFGYTPSWPLEPVLRTRVSNCTHAALYHLPAQAAVCCNEDSAAEQARTKAWSVLIHRSQKRDRNPNTKE